MSANPTYQPYTREFDRDISASEYFAEQSDERRELFSKARASDSRLASPAEITAFLTEFREISTGRDKVVILVDQSGSSRGARAALAAKAVDLLACGLESAGIDFAVVGFTTNSWKGGNSFEKWLDAGRPHLPGRLADRLHIIYKPMGGYWSEGGEASARATFDLVYREQTMREDIYGEAIEWASHLLVGAKSPAIVIVGDGMPGEEKTLMCNGADFLRKHMEDMLVDARAKGIATALIRTAGLSTVDEYGRCPRVDVLADIDRNYSPLGEDKAAPGRAVISACARLPEAESAQWVRFEIESSLRPNWDDRKDWDAAPLAEAASVGVKSLMARAGIPKRAILSKTIDTLCDADGILRDEPQPSSP